MEMMSPFETQKHSKWFINMRDVARNGFDDHELPWPKKCLMAFPAAGVEGKTLIGREIEAAVAPIIGFPPQRCKLGDAVTFGERHGIIIKTGTKRRAEGQPRMYPEYEIIGHLELDRDSGDMFAVSAASRKLVPMRRSKAIECGGRGPRGPYSK